MKLKTKIFILLLLLFSVGNSFAAVTWIYWSNFSADRSWENPANWDLFTVPQIQTLPAEDAAMIESNVNGGVLITDGMDVGANILDIGVWAAVMPAAELEMTGGSVTVTNWWQIGDHPGVVGQLLMSGGTINSPFVNVGVQGQGLIEMTDPNGIGGTGGTINLTGDLNIGTMAGGVGQVNLDAGFINCNGLWFRTAPGAVGNMDITGGVVLLDGDWTGQVAWYIVNEWLTAYDNRGLFVVSYPDPFAPGKTSIIAIEPDYAQAWNPTPAWIEGYYAEPAAPADGLLSWSSGAGATSYDVYLGTNFNDVNDVSVSDFTSLQYLDSTAGTSFDPGMLDFGQAYWWRVDAVNSTTSTTTKGKIWSFTVANGKMLDDFESYADTAGLKANWNSTPSDPNLALTLETFETLVLDAQSMRIDFDNTITGNSYAVLDLGTAQNWTGADTRVLSANFFGTESNAAEQMYFYIEDSTGNSSTVPYSVSAEDIKEDRWHDFDVAVAVFVDGTINMASIQKVGIYLAGLNGSGTIYVDNFRVTPPGCFTGHKYAGDLDGDCNVGTADMAIMAEDWLQGDHTLTAQTPMSAFLEAWYKFDTGTGSTADDSSKTNNGTITGAEWVAGKTGNAGDYALNFRGLEANADYVHCGTFDINALGIGGESTVAFWTKWSGLNGRYQCMVSKRFEWSQANWVWDISMAPAADTVFLWTGDGKDSWLGAPPEDYDWVHVAAVFDQGVIRWYYNGVLQLADTYAFGSGALDTIVRIGANNIFNGYNGVMDDVRFYSYALSQEEVISTMGLTELYFPIDSPANIADPEPANSRYVNLADMAVMAADWLGESVWP